MGSQLEGCIGMMCVAVVGGIITIVVQSSNSAIALSAFAYLGTHLVLAGLLVVPFSFICVWAKLDPPPFAFLWSIFLIVVLPATVASIVVAQIYWPHPGSRLTIGAARIGAMACPFILLGVGGSAIEAWMTRNKRT